LGYYQEVKNKSKLKELLKIEELTTGYHIKKDNNLVLHSGITAAVNEGELIAVMGPNGAGKSTLLKTLLGFHRKIGGKIYYKKGELENISVKQLAQLVSVVLTEKPDDIYLNVEEVIMSGRYPYSSVIGGFKKNDFLITNKSAEICGVSNLLGRKFYTLSDGEKQRVMIARALAQDTPLIFLDEPIAFIDSPGKVEIITLLKSVSSKGKGIIMTIHDVEIALEYADILWLIGKDGFFKTGNPDNLVEQGNINVLFDSDNIKFDKSKKKFIKV
jgi:iron complex transport system ATP-binding protein